MFDIPISVTIEDKEYPIRNKGDYRMILDCFKAFNDEQLSQENRFIVALIIFYDNVNDADDLYALFGNNLNQAAKEMLKFFNCGREENVNQPNHPKLYDWEQDAQMIAASVNSVAGKEIRFEPYIHWWTFMGYFMAIGEGTFSTVISIRSKIKKGTKLEKYEQDFKKDNPQYFVWDSSSVADREAMEMLSQIWNS